MSEKPSFLGSAARWTRFTLLAAIAVILGLIVTTPHNEYPLTMSRAQANTIGAAPGYILTSLGAGNAGAFFLVDTNKQVICAYTVAGDRLRLESARKFDNDTDILDASLPAKGNIRVEGGNGVTRDDAKAYWDEVKPKVEELVQKKK